MAQRDVHGAQSAETAVQLSASSPMADRVKAIGASPLMLITSIVALLGVLLKIYKLIQSFQIQFSVLSIFGVDLIYIAFAFIVLGLSLLPCIGLWLIFANSKRALKRPVPYRVGGAIFIKLYCIIIIVLASLAVLLVIIVFPIILFASAALSAGTDLILGIIATMLALLLLGVLVIVYFTKIVVFLSNAKKTATRGAQAKGSVYVVVMNFIMALVLISGAVVRFVIDRFIKQTLGELLDYLQSLISIDLYQFLQDFLRSAIDFGLNRLIPSSINAMALVETIVCVVFLVCVNLLIIKYQRTVVKPGS